MATNSSFLFAHSFELQVTSQAAEKVGLVGYPPCREEETGHRKNKLGSEHPSRKTPASCPVFHRTRKGLCSREKDHLGREGGRADTVPRARAVSSRESPVPYHPAGVRNPYHWPSNLLPSRAAKTGETHSRGPQSFYSNLLSGKHRGYKGSP
ncbi:unnamed protein product [Rangifer tarandus platyrhynchus]|uniref:Uncharacterized protein n=2 Tax=Rangifer tarandus platyrhynchus TaxID=3082113 RepID=A0ABN8YE60_RANTA|nr:unnamed protein product [Rangifer tarandus platyrhynchus]